jgi:predicted transcriptional regulator
MNLKELKTVESKIFSLLEKGLVDPPKEKDIYTYQQVHSNVDFNSKERQRVLEQIPMHGRP